MHESAMTHQLWETINAYRCVVHLHVKHGPPSPKPEHP